MIRKLQPFSSVKGVTFAVGVFVVMALVLAGEKTANAQAQQFGDRGQLVITAENLFGFSAERVAVDGAADTTTSTTSTHLGLLYSDRTGVSPRAPWIGGHFFVIPNLSVGATIGFETTGLGSTTTRGGNSTTTDLGSVSGFVLVPKVGYALMLTNMMGFWFRGGPGFMRRSQSSSDGNSGNADSAWFLSLDALFVLTPAQYIGFYAGPQGNISFTGSHSETQMNATTSWDASYRSFSIDFGLLGYFDL